MDKFIYEFAKNYVRARFKSTENVRLRVISTPINIRRQIKTAAISVGCKQTCSITEAIYWLSNDLKTEPSKICSICNKNYGGKFTSLLLGYVFHGVCSTSCRSRSPEYKAQLEATNAKKYGHTNNMWGDGVREQTKKKWIDKFGYDNPLKSDDIKKKVMATNQERFGVNWPASSPHVLQKYKKTMLERYGVDNSFKTGNPQKTCLLRYGVSNPMQDPTIFAKTMKYKRKTGIFPSGQKYSFQGYEDVAISTLLKEFKEDEIIISNPKDIPIIEYWNPIKGKLCHYFPDIWIPSKNLLIEVKSTYTMQKQLVENLAKQHAAKALGLNHQIWICDKKKILEIY